MVRGWLTSWIQVGRLDIRGLAHASFTTTTSVASASTPQSSQTYPSSTTSCLTWPRSRPDTCMTKPTSRHGPGWGIRPHPRRDDHPCSGSSCDSNAHAPSFVLHRYISLGTHRRTTHMLVRTTDCQDRKKSPRLCSASHPSPKRELVGSHVMTSYLSG